MKPQHMPTHFRGLRRRWHLRQLQATATILITGSALWRTGPQISEIISASACDYVAGILALVGPA
ncbi:MAG: hypothetical protein IT422_13570 [Pirellulaceae bacterium]|nr:hypothetical protein [Pirellulaceae bacterium]